MSDLQKTRKSIQNEIQAYNNFLEKAKKVDETIPVVQRKKEDAEAKLEIIDAIPEDIGDEIAPIILKFQKPVENYITKNLSVNFEFNYERVNDVLDSTGTAGTVIVTAVNDILLCIPYQASSPVWKNKVTNSMSAFVKKVS